MILGAAARRQAASAVSEPFFAVPDRGRSRPPCTPRHASPIVDVASRSAADREMQSGYVGAPRGMLMIETIESVPRPGTPATLRVESRRPRQHDDDGRGGPR
jgi:hypothetical protein